jgi:hypothetical protein
MNFPFKIELLKVGQKSTLYSIRLKGEKESEFDKFLQNSEVKCSPHFQSLLVRIEDIANRFGCQNYLFKEKESGFTDPVVALSRGNLRLYCCRYGNIILILGSGGVKDTRTYQENPELHQKVKIMAYVAKRIDQRITDKEIEIKNNQFIGDLNFEKE